MIVADTNLIAYLWLPGPHTPVAEAVVRRDPDWCAPLLWRSELRSVLMSEVDRRRIDLPTAVGIATAAEDHLRGRELAVTSDRVLDCATSSGCSTYDCEFVVLAQELRVPLITNDAEILEAFPAVARSPSSFAST